MGIPSGAVLKMGWRHYSSITGKQACVYSATQVKTAPYLEDTFWKDCVMDAPAMTKKGTLVLEATM